MRSGQRRSTGDRRAGKPRVVSPIQRGSRGIFRRAELQSVGLFWSMPRMPAMWRAIRGRQSVAQSWRSDRRATAHVGIAARRRLRPTARFAPAPPSSDRSRRSMRRCHQNNAATVRGKLRRLCRSPAPKCLARRSWQAKPRKPRSTHRAACPHFRG